MSLNHLWQIDHKSSLSTAAYMSIGTGAGYSGTGVQVTAVLGMVRAVMVQ